MPFTVPKASKARSKRDMILAFDTLHITRSVLFLLIDLSAFDQPITAVEPLQFTADL